MNKLDRFKYQHAEKINAEARKRREAKKKRVFDILGELAKEGEVNFIDKDLFIFFPNHYPIEIKFYKHDRLGFNVYKLLSGNYYENLGSALIAAEIKPNILGRLLARITDKCKEIKKHYFIDRWNMDESKRV